MIQSKQDYEFYLMADRIALDRTHIPGIKGIIYRKFIRPDEIWDFLKLLRKIEFLKNCKPEKIYILHYAMCLRKLHDYQTLLGFSIHPNNFGPGLSISHPGQVVVSVAARIGENCRIHPGVTIAREVRIDSKAPHLGNNIYIGPGVRIYGPIEIADNIVIGANSVVNRSFTKPGITIAGIPAKKVSDNDSSRLVIRATDLIRQKRRKETKIRKGKTKSEGKALQILKVRYAKGEITYEQFERMKKNLEK